MQSLKIFMVSAVVTAFMLLGSVGDQLAAQERSTEASVSDQAPKTLAILPFENNSITDPEHYAPLSKGLPAMLITDLNRSGSMLQLIERTKIQDLLKEMTLSQSGSVDESTAVSVGKVLGAQTIAFGSFIVLGSNVRMDVRIIKVETSELVMAESIMGDSDDFMDLERSLAQKIAASLKVAFTPETTASKSDINAALYFSKGLEAWDRGDQAEAKRLFNKCIELDPTYKEQVDKL